MRENRVFEILPELEDIANRYFRGSYLEVENKDDLSFDPVTRADREIEARFREAILEKFPEDEILGEEQKFHKGASGYRWVIDPIDGTRAFVIGAPSYAILIALEKGEKNQLAVVSQPFTGERFIARNGDASWQRGEVQKPIAVSDCQELCMAKIATTFPEVGTKTEEHAFRHLAKKCKLTRYGMDAYAYALLASGHLDLVVEAGLKPFDYKAPLALIEAAGGVVSNWRGQPPKGVDRIIAAATKPLWERALAELSAKI